MHITCEPPILYFGTPIVLISTVNEDSTFNLAPMSSAFWLMWRCVLGLGNDSKTTQNILRTGECVLNLPSSDQVGRSIDWQKPQVKSCFRRQKGIRLSA